MIISLLFFSFGDYIGRQSYTFYLKLTNYSVNRNKEKCKKYVEVKNSNNVTLKNNFIEANAHYVILVNQANDNLIQENTLVQHSSTNWAVIRFYGEKSVNNKALYNTLERDYPKKGKRWDNYEGASNNTYVEKK